MKNWQGTRILVIGAARQGLAITRYLLKQGAFVLLNDQKPAEELVSETQGLNHLNLRFSFGGHPITLLENIDLIIASGGVPLDLPIIQQAIERGIPLSNEAQIFMENVKANVIGITGSAGKTTTTVLVGEIAKNAAHKEQKVWVGGNIGTPLIEQLDEIKTNDLVVLELSSFQLDLISVSPHIAAVLNITPNHLDRHANMQAYIRAKTHILDYQTKDDFLILNREDKGSWDLSPKAKGNLVTFGLKKPESDLPATFLSSDNTLDLIESANITQIMPKSELKLKGEHNILNALAACAIAYAAGFSKKAIRSGIGSVKGIPHRLEFVRELKGVAWYNDSIATAPERSIAAIHSFQKPIILLLGGRDKNLPWQDLSKLVHKRIKHLVIFGEAIELISRTIGPINDGDKLQDIKKCNSLKDAVQTAAELAEAGDVVLLAPGGTSFDEFCDFEERGESFKQWVKALE